MTHFEPLTPAQQAQRNLDDYLAAFGAIYSNARHPEHRTVSAEVAALSREVSRAQGVDPDQPLTANGL